ncbi:MAG: glycosyltransferase [Crocinitomicaceae bacterium]|nr:glycosyltransferase [Crocinitomicaceae bacterium]
MKVVIVGLPMFTDRLRNGLSEFDAKSKYIRLDTYGSRMDQLKGLYHIPRADCLFSINGTIKKSKAFDLAFKNNVPVVMNWVGTDVVRSIANFKNGDFLQSYIDNAIHLCEVSWIQEELKEIGINAEILNFACFEKRFDTVDIEENNQLTVLSYISETRLEFYGIEAFLNLAQKFPDVQFKIAGAKAESYEPLPSNVKALGWVKDMNAVFDEAHVCMRYTEHDGLSSFILEALARGKQVLYKNAYDHCLHCPDEEGLESQLRKIKGLFDSGSLGINKKGIDFISTEFCKDEIYGNLTKKLKDIAK